MSSNDPFLPDEAPPPPREDTIPGPLPLVPPPGPAATRPVPPLTFPLHPGFWWALLWCFGMLMVTHLPAGLGAGVLIVIVVLVQSRGAGANLPDTLANLADQPVFSFAIGLALFFGPFLMILFTWLALRNVAGLDWRRQVALKRPRLAHVLLIFALTPAFMVVALAVQRGVQDLGFPTALGKPGDVPGVVCFLASLFTALSLAGLVCLLLRLTVGPYWGRRLFPSWYTPAPLGVSLLAVVAFVAVTAWLYRTWLPGFRDVLAGLAGADQSGMDDLERLFREWPLVVGVFLVGVMPGVSEELFCRAFLGRGLVGTHGYVWGVLLTSFLFGLIHLDPCQGTMAVVAGVALHLVYIWSRSLLLPMLLHFLNNSVEVTLRHIPATSGLVDALVGPSFGVLLGASCALTVAVGLALYQSRARLVPLGEPAWQPAYPGVAWPPEGSNTAVESPPVHPGLAGLLLLTLAGFAAALVYSLAGKA